MPLAIRRRRAPRLALTSPARPEADSTLVKAIVVTVSAKTRSDHVGALPRWIGSSSVWGLKNSASPSTTISSCSARSPATSIPMRRELRPPLKPRTLMSTTNAMNAERQQQRLGVVAERMPEDPQVLRRRVARDRDQDDVVEQDRPARDEADELVEGVAGEHRRAAPLRVQRGALDVGHRGQPEHQRRHQEDHRREAERMARRPPPARSRSRSPARRRRP